MPIGESLITYLCLRCKPFLAIGFFFFENSGSKKYVVDFIENKIQFQ
jgi:hypothetical protein